MSNRACAVDDCAGAVRARGWCNKHYRRWRRSGDPLKAAFERGDSASNFWSKVRRAGDQDCWLFTGYVTPDGYGRFVWDGGSLAHRYAYETQVGPIPAGLDIDHACHSAGNCQAVGRNCPHRRCVNPAHLAPTEPDENRGRAKPGARGKSRGAQQRAKTHCPRGHVYDEANTYIDHRGCRNCRACRRKTV